MRIDAIDDDTATGEYVRLERGTVAITLDGLKRSWQFVTPDLSRRISLTLAADTTATECGNCPCITDREQCGAFGQRDLDNNAEGTFLRLPECIAAEVPNG